MVFLGQNRSERSQTATIIIYIYNTVIINIYIILFIYR